MPMIIMNINMEKSGSKFRNSLTRLLPSLILVLVAGGVISCTDVNNDNKQHGEGWTVMEDPNFHGAKIAESGLLTCQYCHGEDFKGGEVDFSCSRSACHVEAQGVESCNTCHGILSDSTFKSLWPHRGETIQEKTSQETHSKHILGLNNFRDPLDCSECHLVPDSLFAPDHIIENDFTAEINFDSLAAGESTGPTWDASGKTCSNIYCHGNFTQGNNQPVNWLNPVDMNCNFCHDSPPVDHNTNLTNCSMCHSSVVNTDNESIKDLTKHINGEINFN
ncbi:MAG: CxxxxCH/CxxCH domain-containing protein [Candidatus Neomarinimicrobiota bacterium]